MRKLAFSLVLLLACAFGAQADVLYWMIDTGSVDQEFADISWTYATISQVNGPDAPIQLAWPDDSTATHYAKELFNGVVPVEARLANPANYSYLIELWNDSGKVAETPTPYSYAQIQSYLDTQMFDPEMYLSLAGGDFAAVPEPTSGLLFLMGGVLLGLRRRRMA